MVTQFCSKVLRDALGLFATGVCIATTTDGDKRVGITINSFSSVSLDPALVLFSASRKLHSLSAFQRAQGFAINVLGRHQQELSARFAHAGEDKWKGLVAQPGSHGGLIIPDMLASFDCKLHASHDGGDHVIFVGEVTGIKTTLDADPLLYYRSKYRALSELEHLAVA